MPRPLIKGILAFLPFFLLSLSIFPPAADAKGGAVEDILSASDVFGGLKQTELTALAAATEEEVQPAGAKLLTHGQPLSHLIVIVTGESDVILPNGKTVATVGPGTVLGEMGFVDGRPISADVITKSQCRVLKMNAKDLVALLDGNPALGYRVMKNIARKISLNLRSRN